jgi:hypothetical protein
MPDTWMIDITHYLDGSGRIPDDLPSSALRLANYFGSIVASVSARFSGAPHDSVRCRRRPGRRPCPGGISGVMRAGSSEIVWHCPVCGDNGVIHNWKGTIWDRSVSAVLRDDSSTISKILYKRGMLEHVFDTSNVEVKEFLGRNIPDSIIDSILENDVYSLSGTYGDPSAGKPIEYDHLRVDRAGEPVEITFYNRGITLLLAGDDAMRRIHRVCCQLMDTPTVQA